jgi:hypothetical protein
MKFWLILLAGLLGSAPATARTAPIRITIGTTPDGIRITYELPGPVRALAVRAPTQSGPPQGTHIAAAEPGLSYRRGRIESERPFRRATLLITPDDGEVDSVYPLLSRVAGRGFVLFAPYVLPDTPFAAQVAAGGAGYRALPRAEAAGGYVLVGATPASRGSFRALASTTTSAELDARFQARARALLRFYAAKLQRRLARPPILIVSIVDEPADRQHHFFRGDVTRNGVVLLRFHGTADQVADPNSTRQFTSFLAHELFHLWNRRTGEHPMREAWLHEGAADYYAWLATAALWPGEVDLAAKLSGALGGCGAFLADRGLMQLPDGEAMQVRYSCGPIVQWVVDAGVRAASGGRRTGFDLWAGLLQNGRGDYSLAAFLAAARTRAPITLTFLAGLVESGTRWDALAPALNAAGARIEARPPTRGNLSFAATRALVRSFCDDFWGAGFDDAGVYFNSEPCGLPGRFTHLAWIDGTDPMADIPAYLARVRDACARGASLALVLRNEAGESSRTVRCTVPPAPAPLDFRIERPLPPGPALNPRARSGP